VTAQLETMAAAAELRRPNVAASELLSRRSRAGRVLGRILTLFLLTWAVGLAFSLLVFLNRSLPTSVIAVGVALTVGLTAGAGARLLLRGDGAALRAAAAMAAAVGGQLILGWLTFGVVGVHFAAVADAPNWGGLTRVGLGLLASALSLRAWRLPRAGTAPLEPLPALPPPISSPRPQPAQVAGAVSPPRTGSAGRAHPRRIAAAPGWLPRLARLAPRLGRRLGRPGWTRGRVRLSSRAEHSCPYCLEVVRPRDPRGVVTCPVCHTRHHADCWAVTGVCQVPHHHT
jgi:hypothetical protein